MKVILSIAGSDSGAGAGIQQDLKTVTALGQYCVTAITALTAQNTREVTMVEPVKERMLRAQIETVTSDMKVDAIKIGMIPDESAAKVIVDCVSGVEAPIVYDPVMVSTSGTRLMEENCLGYIMEYLFPLCTLITPNLPEARLLAGKDGYEMKDGIQMRRMGEQLVRNHGCAFLIKGGHAEGEEMRDILFEDDGTITEFSSRKIETGNLHGTGCTLSSACATLIGEGLSLREAVKGAKEIIDRGIVGGKDLRLGGGNGPLWLF